MGGLPENVAYNPIQAFGCSIYIPHFLTTKTIAMDYIADIFREYQALPIFLTIGIGFLLGRIKIGGVRIGSVTAVLIVGVIIGQLDISIPGPIKSVFFMMFLFSVGYSVGPKFFASFKGMGLRQVLFAVIMSASCFACTFIAAKIMGYSQGETVGLFSGSQTCSALIGLGTESIQNLPVSADVKANEISLIPICYAVTYIFGTVGTVIILGNFGPRLLGGLDKVRRDTAALQLSETIHPGPTKINPDSVAQKGKRAGVESDLMFMGIAIFIGGAIGAITIYVDSVPISFGTSGGSLLAGLVFGWWRERHPKIGYIPKSALWLMNNLGLNAFIAIVGLSSGASFITGLKEVGFAFFFVGIITTSLPLFLGLWLGHKVFKFHPAITLGCCAGTRTCTASLGAVQTVLDSTVPTIGYTTTYAVSNVLLVIWGLVTVLLV